MHKHIHPAHFISLYPCVNMLRAKPCPTLDMTVPPKLSSNKLCITVKYKPVRPK